MLGTVCNPLLLWVRVRLHDDCCAVDNLIPYYNISQFTQPGATTVLINTLTGDRVPHWTERDAFDQSYGIARPALLILQPAVPLNASTRYVIGVAGLVDDATRSPVVPWSAFAALRVRKKKNEKWCISSWCLSFPISHRAQSRDDRFGLIRCVHMPLLRTWFVSLMLHRLPSNTSTCWLV